MENVFLVYNAKFKTKSVVKCIFLALKAKNGINSQMYIPRIVNDYKPSTNCGPRKQVSSTLSSFDIHRLRTTVNTVLLTQLHSHYISPPSSWIEHRATGHTVACSAKRT